MLSNLVQGLTSLRSPEAIIYLFAGALIGMFIGVIPGLSGAVVLSIMLAFVYHVNLIGTICLFLGSLAGSYYSASVTSILLNTPAHPEAFAVTFDGHPMARRGQAARALGISAASTCLGGFVGCLVLVGFIQIMNVLPQVFHPPEYLAVVTIAMLLVGTLGTDSVTKAVGSMGVGFIISSMGPSNITGVMRFSFGMLGLLGGVSLVGLCLGLFAIPQMVMVFGTKTTVAKQDMTGREVSDARGVEFSQGSYRQVLGGVVESVRHWVSMVMAGLIGALTGLIPGMGGFAANFLSYGIARQVSPKRDQFGTGIPEGIIAPEGASLAKEAGSMIPVLGLSIPGGVGGALFISALTIKGIRTGFGFTSAYPVLPYQIVWVIALAGLIGTAAGVISGPQLAKVTKIPGPILVPFMFALAVVGPFLADVSFFSVVEVLVFGVIGLVLRRLRFSLATLILGLVLGPTFESNIYLVHNVYRGFSFIQAQPFADVLFVIAIAILVLKAVEIRRARRKRLAAREDRLAGIDDAVLRAEAVRQQRTEDSPYPLLAVITTALLAGTGIFWTVYSLTNYSLATGLFPTVGGLLLGVPMLFLLPVDVRNYWSHRQLKAAPADSGGDGPGPERDSVLSPAEHADGPLPLTPAANGNGGGSGPAAVPDDLSPASGPGGREVLVGFREALVTVPVTGLIDAKAPEAGTGVKDRSWGRQGQYRRELTALAWLAALIAGCYVFGFFVAVPAFMVAYGMLSTSDYLRTIRSRVIFSVLSAAVMWLVTYEMINVLTLPFTPMIQF